MSAVHLVILGCGEGEMIDTCIARWKKTQEEDAGIRVGSSELRFEGPNGTWGVGFRRWLFGGSHGNILQCSASASKSHAGDLPRRKASCQTMRIVR